MIDIEVAAVPPPEPERPTTNGPADWVRHNLFRSTRDSIVTVVSALVVGYVVYRAVRYVFVTGRWEIVRVNLRLFLVGRYPSDELWRISLAIALIAGFAGLVGGFIGRRRIVTGRVPPGPALPWWRVALGTAGRLWPLLVGSALLLSMVTTIGPWLTLVGAVAAAAIGRLVGPHLPGRSGPFLVLFAVLGFGALILFLRVPLDVTDWGGIMLNLFLAVAGITLCFPLGLLLALGRRSTKLPLVRAMSVAYIEFFRGVPLYVLLLLAFIAVPLFLPGDTANPSVVLRAIVAMTLFTAAYVAEIVRGGLQSLPRGQTEAAQALGLSPIKTSALIVLPQALRNVIPSLVGQFISLFKDTTLAAAAMGMLDLLNVYKVTTAQPAFDGQGLTGEVIVFVMLLFWVGCITMSRESQRLERKLGVGTR
ncbi:MAG: amino acid ABC transporter permease [Ilumatobacteraceae bacterium]